MFTVSRLVRINQVVRCKVIRETRSNDTFYYFWYKREVGNRAVVREFIFVKGRFFEKINRDSGRKSDFFSYPLLSTLQLLLGAAIEIFPWHLVQRNCNVLATDGNDDAFSGFDTIPACDRQLGRETKRYLANSPRHACASRDKNRNEKAASDNANRAWKKLHQWKGCSGPRTPLWIRPQLGLCQWHPRRQWPPKRNVDGAGECWQENPEAFDPLLPWCQ